MTPSVLPRRLLGALAVLVAVGALAGCGVIQSTHNTALALDRAGFSRASVNANSSNGNEVVSADVTVSHAAGSDDADRAARVVWATFRYRIDELDVAVNGADGADFPQSYSRSEMVGTFGQRDPALDRHTVGGAFVSAGKTVAVVVGIGGLLFVAFIVIVVVLVVRGSRRRRTAAPPYVWTAAPPQGWAPAAPPQGWAPAAPPQGWAPAPPLPQWGQPPWAPPAQGGQPPPWVSTPTGGSPPGPQPPQ